MGKKSQKRVEFVVQNLFSERIKMVLSFLDVEVDHVNPFVRFMTEAIQQYFLDVQYLEQKFLRMLYALSFNGKLCSQILDKISEKKTSDMAFYFEFARIEKVIKQIFDRFDPKGEIFSHNLSKALKNTKTPPQDSRIQSSFNEDLTMYHFHTPIKEFCHINEEYEKIFIGGLEKYSIAGKYLCDGRISQFSGHSTADRDVSLAHIAAALHSALDPGVEATPDLDTTGKQTSPPEQNEQYLQSSVVPDDADAPPVSPLSPAKRIADSDTDFIPSPSKKKKKIHHCAVCRELGNLQCSKCKSTYYCSEKCQTVDSTFHKKGICKQSNINPNESENSPSTASDEMLSACPKNISGISSIPSNSKRLQCRGLVGLANLGNSCYLNAALQCLSHTFPLVKYLITYNYEKDMMFVTQVSLLLKKMWLNPYPSSALRPTSLRKLIRTNNADYSTSQQQDAHDVLVYLLDQLHEDVNKFNQKPYVENSEGNGEDDEKNSSESDNSIQEIIGCQLRSQLICPVQTCNEISVSSEYASTIQLAIPFPSSSQMTLDKCLSHFTSEEILDQDNRWYCNNCQTYRQANKMIQLWTLPKVLIIGLKRFKTVMGGQGEKITTYVDFPINGLNISPYCHQDKSKGEKMIRMLLTIVISMIFMEL